MCISYLLYVNIDTYFWDKYKMSWKLYSSLYLYPKILVLNSKGYLKDMVWNIKHEKNHRSIFDRKWIRKLPILLTTAKLKTFWYCKKVYFLFTKKFYKEWPYVNPNEQKTKVNVGYFTLVCKRKHRTLIIDCYFDDLFVCC